MFADLFKSDRQKAVEQRLALRRAQASLNKTLGRLDRQRQAYFVMGRAAAKNGSRDKVRLIAKAILKCRGMERQIGSVLSLVDAFEAQREINEAKKKFAGVLNSTLPLVRDADVTRAVGEVDAAHRSVEENTLGLESLVSMMQSAGIGQNLGEATEAEDLRELEIAMYQAAGEALPTLEPIAPKQGVAAAADPIDRDLRELERELNLVR